MSPTEWIVPAVMKPEARRLAAEAASLSPEQVERVIARYIEQALQELEPSDLPTDEVIVEALMLLINEHERVLRAEKE